MGNQKARAILGNLLTMAIERTSFESVRNALVFAFVVATAVVFVTSLFSSPKGPPFAGFRKRWEPAFLVRLRFSWGARDMIHDGYEKLCWETCICD